MPGLKEITLDELIADFHPALHDTLREKLADADALVVFENLQLDASECGQTTAVQVGPGKTYTSVESCEGKWLHDLPSQRQYAVSFVRNPVRVPS